MEEIFQGALRHRRALLWALQGAAAGALAAYAVLVGVGDASGTLGTGLYNGLIALSAAVCIGRGLVRRSDRAAWLVLGVALAAWAVGDLYYSLRLASLDAPPAPSFSDGMFWLFYAGAAVALGLMARSRSRGASAGRWLDAALAAFGCAALGAAVLVGIVDDALVGSRAEVLTALTYPIADTVLIGIVAGALVLADPGPLRRALTMVGCGLTVTAAADSIYLVQLANDSYAEALVPDVLWPLATLLVARAALMAPSGANGSATGRAARPRRFSVTSALVLGAAMVALMTYDHYHRIHTLALALSAIAVLVVLIRLSVSLGENRLARRQLAALAAEQAALRRVATAVAAGTDPAAVIALVAEEVGGLLSADAAAVTRLEATDTIHAVGFWVNPAGPACDVPFRPVPGDGRSASATALQLRAPARVDYLLLDGPTAKALPPWPYRWGVAVPIWLDNRPWGTVTVARTTTFPPNAERQLESFAELVGTALANADARARLAAQAASDALTGLANHRTFQQRLEVEVARAQRHGRELALVILDIDHFKQVNDALGHQVGDDVLRELAGRLIGVSRSDGVVARIGGEEFAILLPETDALGAYQVAERARAVVGGTPFPNVGRLTVSSGVCDLARAGDAQRLVTLTDGALYWAKAHGRDVSFIYSPEVVEELSAEERARRLERSQALAGLRALARAVDAKDHSTLSHSERVADMAGRLAHRLGWSDERTALLREAALVHDVGKIGVSDSILFKDGPLSEDEYEVVKRHAALGAEIAGEVLSPEQVRWVRHHHERWDGAGYPDELAGEAIPPGARILAVADAFDVMTGSRHYTAPVSPAEALKECRRNSGSQFAPRVVDALDAVWHEPDLGPQVGSDELEPGEGLLAAP